MYWIFGGNRVDLCDIFENTGDSKLKSYPNKDEGSKRLIKINSSLAPAFSN